MAVGKKIKRLLKQKGMTIKGLSEITGISLNTLYSITKRDSKRVNEENLLIIADVLGISVHTLLGTEKSYASVSVAIDENDVSVGRRIKNCRKARGLTQKQLADMLNIAEMSIRRYECNKRTPSLETFMHIASALMVSPEELISIRQPPHKESNLIHDNIINFLSVLSNDDKERAYQILLLVFPNVLPPQALPSSPL